MKKKRKPKTDKKNHPWYKAPAVKAAEISKLRSVENVEKRVMREK